MQADTTDLAWNMSDQWLKDIAGICRDFTTARREDNLHQAFILLWDMTDRMHFQFKPEENKKLNEVLSKIKILLNKPQTPQGAQLMAIDAPEIRVLLSHCYTLFLGFLNNYERIFVKREFDLWKEIESDFE